MSDGGTDLFHKIDALFEKRAPDALVDKGLEHEDFPLLTEVIPPKAAWDGTERRQGERRRGERRAGERPPPPLAPAGATVGAAELERLMQAMEARLTELFIRQQLRLEETVRRAVRAELDQERGGH